MTIYTSHHRKSIFGKANNDLFECGWSQEQIDILLFGTTEEAKYTTFREREGFK